MRTRTRKLDNRTANDSVTPVLDRLTHEERSQVLSGLLDIRSGIVEEAEQLAEEILGVAEADRVAEEVKNDLQNLDMDALGARAGRHEGGYVDVYDAAYALVEEVVQPYVDDVKRRAEVGLMEAASEIGIGLLEGLSACRNPDDGSVLGYAGPETAEQLAAVAAEVMHKVGIRLPLDWFDNLPGDWSEMWAPLVESDS
jgi:hypothetical protein